MHGFSVSWKNDGQIEGFLLRARAMENSLLAGNEATAATNVLALQLR